MPSHVLILRDPQKISAPSLDWSAIGHEVTELAELYQIVKEQSIDLIVVDDTRRDITAAFAMRIRRQNGLTEIWKLVDQLPSDNMREEFIDGYLSRDLDANSLKEKVDDILSDKALLASYRMVARSGKMKVVAQTIRRIAPTEVSVLVVGPSGSGKELVARALHENSNRKSRPYVAINCGALAEGVLESELFGHEKGAFTGSVGKREGLFAKAEGGSVFLDEIGETKTETQVKLLRILEDGTYYPVGSSVPRKANVRVIAATNRDLTEAIAERQFREDLYFRIGVVKIVLPPLFERRQDIQPLLHFFWRESPGIEYTDSALDLLTRYDWPGNVRQLRNFASRMAALKPSGMVDIHDVERFLTEQNSTTTHLPVTTGRTVEDAGQELIYRAILSLGNEIRLLRDLITSHLPSESVSNFDTTLPVVPGGSMEEMEKQLIKKVLTDTRGNRKETSKRLGIGERTLYRKLSKYNLH